jgi:hypothetical protein
MGQSHSTPQQQPLSTLTPFQPKKYLTRIELTCLQYIFNQLKTTFPNGFTCIEPKKFLVKKNKKK